MCVIKPVLMALSLFLNVAKSAEVSESDHPFDLIYSAKYSSKSDWTQVSY